MRILVYSDKARFRLTLAAEAASAKAAQESILPRAELSKRAAPEADIVYLDCRDLDQGEIKKALTRIKKIHPGTPWGCIDPKGSNPDPAQLFYEGACDYIGPALLKNGIPHSRLKQLLSYAEFLTRGAQAPEAMNSRMSSDSKSLPKNTAETRGRGSADAVADCPSIQREPFPGWEGIKAGETREFFFLYAAIANSSALKAKIGEKRFASLREALMTHLRKEFADTDGQAWMQADSAVLFLIPPPEGRARLVIEACLHALLSTPLLGYEQLGLESPLSLVFALHYGKTPYQAPGRTGTVVSEDVNFIFHLGTKKAQAERISVSARAMAAIPPRLTDHFSAAGEFEGVEICASRRFL